MYTVQAVKLRKFNRRKFLKELSMEFVKKNITALSNLLPLSKVFLNKIKLMSDFRKDVKSKKLKWHMDDVKFYYEES